MKEADDQADVLLPSGSDSLAAMQTAAEGTLETPTAVETGKSIKLESCQVGMDSRAKLSFRGLQQWEPLKCFHDCTTVMCERPAEACHSCADAPQPMDPFLQQKMRDRVALIMQRVLHLLQRCEEIVMPKEQLIGVLTGPGAVERILSYYPQLCQAADCWPEAFEDCRQLLITRSDCLDLPATILLSGLRILQLMKMSRIFLGVSSPSLQKLMLQDDARVRECFEGIPSRLLPSPIKDALKVILMQAKLFKMHFPSFQLPSFQQSIAVVEEPLVTLT